mmetsp:Transcript_19794/g.17501  ORF Transcript_19794/g.17501 Transcript_19794/m.17501 type:complete len:81 (-) Transcript_19794:373-615(-)
MKRSADFQPDYHMTVKTNIKPNEVVNEVDNRITVIELRNQELPVSPPTKIVENPPVKVKNLTPLILDTKGDHSKHNESTT